MALRNGVRRRGTGTGSAASRPGAGVGGQVIAVWRTAANEPASTLGGHRPRSRPSSSFMISLDPAQILVTCASFRARAIRYSFM